MFVIWRRPDGFHGAEPSDFQVVEIEKDMRVWLHKSEHHWFPFQISGGWQDEEQTKKLNLFTNMLSESSAVWPDKLGQLFHETMTDDPAQFLDDLDTWLEDLAKNPKGDKWERDIIERTVEHIQKNIKLASAKFKEYVAN